MVILSIEQNTRWLALVADLTTFQKVFSSTTMFVEFISVQKSSESLGYV